MSNVLSQKMDASRGGLENSGKDVEQYSFPRAVGSDYAEDFVAIQVEADGAQSVVGAKGDTQILNGKNL
jgi:hypothetical protein